MKTPKNKSIFIPPTHEEIMLFLKSEMEAGIKILNSFRCRVGQKHSEI